MVQDKFGKLASKKVVRMRFDDLVKKGFINRKLFNPRRTKSEYFWLLIFHLVRKRAFFAYLKMLSVFN
jgi:DNA-binding HxlR family transcriptional regulator